MWNPTTSLPLVLSILDTFGSYISWISTRVHFCPSIHQPKIYHKLFFPFKWTTDGFKYLGDFIGNSIRHVFTWTPLKEKCKLNFQCWASLSLSLVGRVNLVKMVVLPKFLYLFQHIPILIKKLFFRSLIQLISSFLWGNNNLSSPRIITLHCRIFAVLLVL